MNSSVAALAFIIDIVVVIIIVIVAVAAPLSLSALHPALASVARTEAWLGDSWRVLEMSVRRMPAASSLVQRIIAWVHLLVLLLHAH